MGPQRPLLDFNKELLFGEVGSLICAPLTASIASLFGAANSTISTFAVIGAVFGASLFWIIMRIYDQKKDKTLSIGKMAGDIAFFTPVAFLITLLVYYPSIFLGSRYFLNQGDKVIYAVVISQTAGFLIFVCAMNFYRYLLLKIFGKEI